MSEFVDSLKTELESTFKEEISVYFDINPHGGPLETHDVDELKGSTNYLKIFKAGNQNPDCYSQIIKKYGTPLIRFRA